MRNFLYLALMWGLRLLCVLFLLSFSVFAQGNGIAVGNCIVGQTEAGYIRAKSEIIGSKYFYISPADKIPNCKASLKAACLIQVQTWITLGAISSKVLNNTGSFYWYVDPQRYSCKDIDERIPDSEGVPMQKPDLDHYYPDWKNVVRLYEHPNDPLPDSNMVRDFKDLVEDIYDRGPWDIILAVSAILALLLGVKSIQGFFAGPLAAEPLSILAALSAILAIAIHAGLLDTQSKKRYEKYLGGVEVTINNNVFTFEHHEDLKIIEVDEDRNRWMLRSSELCNIGSSSMDAVSIDSDC